MEGFSNIAFSPLLLSWLTKSGTSSVWGSTRQRIELTQEGCGSSAVHAEAVWECLWTLLPWLKRSVLCILVVVSTPLSWFARYWWGWIDDLCGEHEHPPQLQGVSLGHLLGGDKCPRNSGRCWPSLQTVHVGVSSDTDSDFATSMFSCFRGDGRDVLSLVRGRRRAELPLVCILPLRLRFTSSILEMFKS